LPFERVDWTPFDYVAVDAYRAAHNAATYREEIRDLHRHGRPVAVRPPTESSNSTRT
jgi:2-keto-3-deoxy-L-rhamnonate aldolase RhmA